MAMEMGNMARSQRTLTKKQLTAIHEGLDKANLGGFDISMIHLRPRAQSVGMAAVEVEAEGPCHSVQLANGHWIITCK
jgi:hypothetical protein